MCSYILSVVFSLYGFLYQVIFVFFLQSHGVLFFVITQTVFQIGIFRKDLNLLFIFKRSLSSKLLVTMAWYCFECFFPTVVAHLYSIYCIASRICSYIIYIHIYAYISCCLLVFIGNFVIYQNGVV